MEPQERGPSEIIWRSSLVLQIRKQSFKEVRTLTQLPVTEGAAMAPPPLGAPPPWPHCPCSSNAPRSCEALPSEIRDRDGGGHTAGRKQNSGQVSHLTGPPCSFLLPVSTVQPLPGQEWKRRVSEEECSRKERVVSIKQRRRKEGPKTEASEHLAKTVPPPDAPEIQRGGRGHGTPEPTWKCPGSKAGSM